MLKQFLFNTVLMMGLASRAVFAADAEQPAQNSTKLDPRIDASRMTQLDPPPLPEHVILPMPPTFRIAEDAAHTPLSAAHWARAQQAIENGLAYLIEHQDKRGGWMTDVRASPTDHPEQPSDVSVAVTGLILKSFGQAGDAWLSHPVVQKAEEFVLSRQNDDGSFGGGPLSNYVTSTVVMALNALSRYDYRVPIHQATMWLQREQWDDSEGLDQRKDWYGGAGYGSRGRPDLSNTQLMLEAMYDSGLSPDEPAFQRALVFVSRTQNLKETNSSSWAGNDGGFVYTTANGGESMASEAAGEGRYGENIPEGQPRSLHSYGSMTYAGFKSMLYAGLSQDDLRVRAAFDWIRRHWTFDENPGLGQQGLYYYYHSMSRALAIGQQTIVTDAEGTDHNWREELIDAITSRQRDDGSWMNEADRWLEGHPELATAYALLALEEALKPSQQAE